MKSAFASRTIILNLIAFVLAALALPDVAALIPPKYMPAIMGMTALLNLVLRFSGGRVTTWEVTK